MPRTGQRPAVLPEVGTIILPACTYASESAIQFDLPLCKQVPHKKKKQKPNWMFRAFQPTDDGPLGMPALPDVLAENGDPLPMLMGRDYRFDGRRVVMTWVYGHPSEQNGLVIFAPWMIRGVDMIPQGTPEPDGSQVFQILNVGLEITAVKERVAIAKIIRVAIGHVLPRAETFRRRSRRRKTAKTAQTDVTGPE